MKGILLLNTGSPKTSERADVRFFIETMLSDPQVMTVPDWFRPILVKGIIGPLRQFTSAKHYSLIWDKKSRKSPLLYHAENLAEQLRSLSGLQVEIAMRYGEPQIADALELFSANAEELTELIVLPLFPHYADSSYKTAVDAVCDCMAKKTYGFGLKIIEPYYNHPAYIKALAHSIMPYIEGGFDKLVFNYHSLPLNYVEAMWKKGHEFDYVYQTKETVRLLLKQLGINQHKARVAYSSAMGWGWLKPSLNDILATLAKQGAQKVLVVSPGFASDNLETLYDIDILAREEFLKHGGTEFIYIPCLNSCNYWAEAIQKITS